MSVTPTTANTPKIMSTTSLPNLPVMLIKLPKMNKNARVARPASTRKNVLDNGSPASLISACVAPWDRWSIMARITMGTRHKIVRMM